MAKTTAASTHRKGFIALYAFISAVLVYCLMMVVGFLLRRIVGEFGLLSSVLYSFLFLAILLYLSVYVFEKKFKQVNAFKLTWLVFAFYIGIGLIVRIFLSVVYDSFSWWGTIIPLFGLAEIIAALFVSLVYNKIKTA
jgi:hypothetical protein